MDARKPRSLYVKNDQKRIHFWIYHCTKTASIRKYLSDLATPKKQQYTRSYYKESKIEPSHKYYQIIENGKNICIKSPKVHYST